MNEVWLRNDYEQPSQPRWLPALRPKRPHFWEQERCPVRAMMTNAGYGRAQSWSEGKGFWTLKRDWQDECSEVGGAVFSPNTASGSDNEQE